MNDIGPAAPPAAAFLRKVEGTVIFALLQPYLRILQGIGCLECLSDGEDEIVTKTTLVSGTEIVVRGIDFLAIKTSITNNVVGAVGTVVVMTQPEADAVGLGQTLNRVTEDSGDTEVTDVTAPVQRQYVFHISGFGSDCSIDAFVLEDNTLGDPVVNNSSFPGGPLTVTDGDFSFKVLITPEMVSNLPEQGSTALLVTVMPASGRVEIFEAGCLVALVESGETQELPLAGMLRITAKKHDAGDCNVTVTTVRRNLCCSTPYNSEDGTPVGAELI